MVNICYSSIYNYSDDSFQDFSGVIVQEVALLRSWVDQHISDYSPMYQLCQAQKLVDYLALSDRFRDITDDTKFINTYLTLRVAFPCYHFPVPRIAMDVSAGFACELGP